MDEEGGVLVEVRRMPYVTVEMDERKKMLYWVTFVGRFNTLPSNPLSESFAGFR